MSAIRIETETLSDGSKVYNLIIGGASFPCLSEKHALEAYDTISNALALCGPYSAQPNPSTCKSYEH